MKPQLNPLKRDGRKWGLCCAVGVIALVFSGCASPQMKGTPFYTGEYEMSWGPVEDRVNLWPLLYYREPVLSILWPLVELSGDHFAFRPLMSVYGIEEGKRVYNILWPIAQFDRRTDSSRVFPLFWGKDYKTFFPLYWRRGHPFGPDGGHDRLIPLWWFDRDRGGYDAYLLGPFVHFKDRHGEKGWHVWPLMGSYASESNVYRFMLWPLGHQWSGQGELQKGSTILPLYYYERDPSGSLFISLPYSRSDGTDGCGWQLVPPFFYHSAGHGGSRLLTPLYSYGRNTFGADTWSWLIPFYYTQKKDDERLLATLLGGFRKDDNSLSWMAFPFLSGGRKCEGEGEVWIAGAMGHASWDRDSRTHHVFPFYYLSADKSGSFFVSLPWSRGTRTDGSSWQLIPPLFYRFMGNDRSTLITPAYAQGARDGGKTRWHTALPLYYYRNAPDEKSLATLLGGYRTNSSGQRWLIYPLLSGGKRNKDGGELWAVAPLFHMKWEKNSVSHHLLPLYYWNGKDRTFISPLTARWRDAVGKQTTIVPPLLSALTGDKKARELWALAGLAHLRWGEKAGAQHVFPFAYWNNRTGTFVSPVATRWRRKNNTVSYGFPPLLSWLSTGEKRSDLWLAGPLAHLSWGEKAGSQYVIPLFYRNKTDGTFISLPAARWKSLNRTHWVIPPLLSGYSSDGKTRNINALLGLFSNSWGSEQGSSGHLMPLYYYESNKAFYTALFGWNRDESKGFVYPLTPLAGKWTGEYSGGWLFPLFSCERHRRTGSVRGTFLWGQYWNDGNNGGSRFFPIYSYRNTGWIDSTPDEGGKRLSCGKEFISLPACWYRNQLQVEPDLQARAKGDDNATVSTYIKRHGFFPLWSYFSERTLDGEKQEVSSRLLLALYDYKHEIKPVMDRPQEVDDYSRARVLWRLWHYERLNNDISVDIFPAITYDRKKDGFKKISFLWRLFRYESGKDGRKLDLLFLPVVRIKTDT